MVYLSLFGRCLYLLLMWVRHAEYWGWQKPWQARWLTHKSWSIITQGMFQLEEINQIVREMWILGCMSIQQLWKSLPACFLFFFLSFSSFGESPHPPSATIYLLVVDHRTGHVPVERNQPDGERNVESGLHIDPATLEEFACMFLFFFFLFFFWWVPPPTIHHFLLTHGQPLCRACSSWEKSTRWWRNVPVFGMGVARWSSNIAGVCPTCFYFFIWWVPPPTICRHLTCY